MYKLYNLDEELEYVCNVSVCESVTVCLYVCVCALGSHNGLESTLIILHQGGPKKGLDQIRSTIRLWMTLVFFWAQKSYR